MKNTGRPTIAYLSTLFSRNRINNSIWEGVRQAAEEENMNVVCLPINPLNMPQNYYRMANILLNLVTEKIFDGILVWGSGISNQADPKDIDAFFKSIESFPMVNIGQNFPGIPGIIVDNYNGMYDLCEHIIQHHGCRRPAFIRGPVTHEEAEIRFQAYQDALKENNIAYEPSLVSVGDFSNTSGIKCTRNILDSGKKTPDAIICANDMTAFGVMLELDARNMNVPEDILVTGFDDVEESRNLKTPLTTIVQPFKDMARTAMKMLAGILAGTTDQEQMVTIPSRLVLRQSCGCQNILNIRPAKGRYSSSDKQDRIIEILDTPGFSELETVLNAKQGSEFKNNYTGFLGHIPSFLADFSRRLKNTESLTRLDKYIRSYNLVRELIIELSQDNPEFNDSVENLLLKMKILLDSRSQNLRSSIRLKEEYDSEMFQSLSNRLLASFSLFDLFSTISAEFPKLGLTDCYLAFYKNPGKSLENAEMKLCFSKHTRAQIFEPGIEFLSDEIIPDSFWMDSEKIQYLIEPLYFENEHLGFMIIGGEFKAGHLYTTLQQHLSVAIKGALLLQEQETLLEKLEKRAEELQITMNKLTVSNKDLEHFTFIASHDLKEPLRKIQIFSERIHDEYSANIDPEGQLLLERMNRASGRMKLLINNLLEYSKITSSEKHFVQVDLAEIVTTVISDLEIAIKQSGAEIQRGKMLCIEADPLQIRQMMQNLIDNAIKFRVPDKSPIIRISSEKTIRDSVAYCKITIGDNGIGIDKKYLSEIFKVFHRLHSQSEYEGTGIGLAICKRVVERHNGWIDVESSEGGGTVFTVLLPISQNPSE